MDYKGGDPLKRPPETGCEMKVIIAIDGSEYSDAAIRLYRDDFGKPEDHVRIVSVVVPLDHVVGAPFGVVEDFYSEYISDARKNADAWLKNARSILCEGSRKFENVETEILIGSVAQAVVETAANWQAGLIVVGSHGRGFWKRVYLGSVSSSIVHNAPCSVLIARSPERTTSLEGDYNDTASS